jgi:hypothetical protein
MEIYSKLFDTKYCLSNIFTIISDMEINFEKEKKTKPYTVETIPKSYRTILETEANSILLTHIYMNAHFLGLVPTLQ